MGDSVINHWKHSGCETLQETQVIVGEMLSLLLPVRAVRVRVAAVRPACLQSTHLTAPRLDRSEGQGLPAAVAQPGAP